MNEKIQKLVDFLSSDKNLAPIAIKQFLMELKLAEKDLMHWADFHHPKHEGYGRKMVYQGTNYEVMVMSWMPGDFSGVHNHGYTQWGAVQVFGNASHYIYRMDAENDIKIARKESFQSGDIAMVNNALIHQMGNQTAQPYLSLHIYGTPDSIDDVTADSLIYEIEKNRIVKTTGGAFFMLPEEEVEHVGHLTCKDLNTQYEFVATIFPKSLYFKNKDKQQIKKWICEIEKEDVLM